MSVRPLSVLYPAIAGMDMRQDYATYIPQQSGQFVQWTRNLRIKKGYWRTRLPFREIKLEQNEEFHSKGWQGAIIYHPQEGLGVHYQGRGRDRIIASYGGRLFEIDIRSGGITDLSGNAFEVGRSQVPAHLEQAENYVLRTDGVSPTLIHDGADATFYSRGYNRSFPNASSVPNQAGPVRYLNNRVWTSAYGRRMYAGDHLHRIDPEEAIDVIRYRDQTYDYLSQWFAPEARQGDTVAISRMTLGGREFVVMHGDNLGMTGIRQGVPRSQWGNEELKLVISNETAATGPYSFAEGDWRLLFRSRRGIEETRLILAEDNTVGGTSIDLGAQIYPLLDAEIKDYLIFNSTVNPAESRRTITTASPRISNHPMGKRAYHKGMYVMNRNPGENIEPGSWAWEGVWTLPDELGVVSQLLDGRIESDQRTYALTQKMDGNGLVEFMDTDGPDTLADGTKILQNQAIRTHKITTDSEYLKNSFDELVFLVRDAQSDLRMELYARTSEDAEWNQIGSANVCQDDCGECAKCCGGVEGGEARITMGRMNLKDARWVQFHLEMWGIASWDFAFQTGTSESLPEKKASKSEKKIDSCQKDCFPIFSFTRRD